MIAISLPPGTYSHHSPASMDAAKRQRGHKVAEDRAKILDALAKCRELTDQEIQALCEIDENAERPRRISLVADGLVMAGTNRRGTRSGGTAGTWLLTDAGKRVNRVVRQVNFNEEVK